MDKFNGIMKEAQMLVERITKSTALNIYDRTGRLLMEMPLPKDPFYFDQKAMALVCKPVQGVKAIWEGVMAEARLVDKRKNVMYSMPVGTDSSGLSVSSTLLTAGQTFNIATLRFTVDKPVEQKPYVEKKVVTHHANPSIPIRIFDWVAYFDGQEEGGPYGYGKTEKEAVDALWDDEL